MPESDPADEPALADEVAEAEAVAVADADACEFEPEPPDTTTGFTTGFPPVWPATEYKPPSCPPVKIKKVFRNLLSAKA